jgi:hypothetical protein
MGMALLRGLRPAPQFLEYHFFSVACQLVTTVIAAAGASPSAGTSARNSWPSAEGS